MNSIISKTSSCVIRGCCPLVYSALEGLRSTSLLGTTLISYIITVLYSLYLAVMHGHGKNFVVHVGR